MQSDLLTIPELQHPVTTRLRLRDIRDCFRANLWDPGSGRMVSYQEAEASSSKAASQNLS